MGKLLHKDYLKRLEEKSELYKTGKIELVSEYIDAKTPIYFNDEFGLCSMMPDALVRAKIVNIISAVDKNQYFLNNLYHNNSHYRDGYFKVIGKYESNHKKILVETVYGLCEIAPSVLLQNLKPIIASAINKTEYFINMAKCVHGEEYDYSITNYEIAKKHVDVFCKKHGEFSVEASSHLMGTKCKICARESASEKQKLTFDEFLERARKVHGDKYDYSFVEYNSNLSNVNIVCPLHGSFKQTPGNHFSGKGCYKCSVYNKSFSQMGESHDIWAFSKWSEYALKSKYFDSYKVYIIRCYNDDESFYKVGKTFRNLKNRFAGKNNMPYKYEVCNIFTFEDGVAACEKEVELKRILREYRYAPKIEFKGMYECFSSIENINLK